MPHIEDLAADLQTALLKTIVAGIQTECILDPDGLNVNLSEYIDFRSGVNIRRAKSIEPYGEMGQYTVGEIRLRMLNKEDFFNSTIIGKQFYYKFSRLYEDKSAADTYARIIKGDGPDFDDATITQVTISDGTNSETFTLSSIDTANSKYDQLNFSGGGSNDFTSGAIVETIYVPGKEVTLKTTVAGATTKVSQFRGLLKGHPDLEAGAAGVILQDKLKTILDIDCHANDYRLFTVGGLAQSTLEYNRTGSSTGELDITQATIDSSVCRIGDWEIEFIDASNGFQVTDPAGEVFTGDILTEFEHDWITIPIEAWTNSFDEGDVISFKTVLAFGRPVNSYNTVPKMIYQLLTAHPGANLATSQLVDANFTGLISNYSTTFAKLNFTQPVKVLKALETLQQHISATLFTNGDGKIDINIYHPRYAAATVRSLSPDADVIELKQDDLGRVDRVKAIYDYDWVNSKFLRELIIPAGSQDSGNEIEIRLPAFHSDAQARACAERIWVKWRKGVKAYQVREKFNYGLALEIGDLLKVSSNHPQFAERLVEVFEIEKDLSSLTVTATVFDLNYSYNNFCFYDVEHDYDTGKLYW